MQIFTRRPALRWLAPLSLVLVVGGTGLVAANADADPRLPPKSAEQLLVDVQQARVDGMSGVVTQSADLGLPALPAGAGAGGDQLMSLLSGSHTLRVWYAGPDKARIALLEGMGETDVILNGADVWTWHSTEKQATHVRLPQNAGNEERPDPSDLPRTPQEAAEQALAAIGPSTAVSTDTSVTVADRDAYELVLTPKDAGSLIGRVAIAVDSRTSIPLRVQVLASDATPIFTVAYSTVSFDVPDATQFDFNPPPGTEVTDEGTLSGPEHREPSEADRKAAQQRAAEAQEQTEVVGEGWTSVVVTELPADAASGQLAAYRDQLPVVSGEWGRGRLLTGTAFSAVLTDDGRLAVGAVRPELLYDALAK